MRILRYILILLGILPVLSSQGRQAVVSVKSDYLSQVKVSAYHLKHTSKELEKTGHASYHSCRIPSSHPVVPGQLSGTQFFSRHNFFSRPEASHFPLTFKEYLEHIYPSHNFW